MNAVEVTNLHKRYGDTVAMDDVSFAVSDGVAALARRRIVAGELRVEQARLDDAFVALTGERSGSRPRSPRITTADTRDLLRDPGMLCRRDRVPGQGRPAAGAGPRGAAAGTGPRLCSGRSVAGRLMGPTRAPA